MRKVILHVIREHENRLTKLEKNSNNELHSTVEHKQQNFVGRTVELQKIKQSFLDNNKKTILSGLGGIGKTSLALEFAHKNKQDFPGGVFWITADTENNEIQLKNAISDISLQINNKESEPEKQANLVTNYFRNVEKKCLLVVDNLDNPPTSTSIVNKLVNGNWLRDSKVNLLITTRLEERDLLSNSFQDSNVISIETFNREDAIKFLCRRAQKQIDDIDATNLADELGYLPLALDQVAALLQGTNVKIKGLIESIKKKKDQFRVKAANPSSKVDESRLSVRTTWKMNIEAIKQSEDSPLAEKVMFIFAFLSPCGFPREIMLNEGEPKINNDDLLDLLDDEVELDYIISVLTKMSLFEETKDSTIRVHRLVQEIIKKELSDNPDEMQEILLLVQRMIAFALTSSESPDSLKDRISQNKDTLSVASLKTWKKVTENADHFLHDLTRKQFKDIENDLSFLKILDHLSLYFFVKCNNKEAVSCSNKLEECLSKLSKMRYMPKFKLPVKREEVENILQLMEPRQELQKGNKHRILSKGIEAKKEADSYMKEEKYEQALEAYNFALECSDELELRTMVHLNKCKCLYKKTQFEECIEESKIILSLKERNKSWLAFLWMSLSYLKIGERERKEQIAKSVLFKLAKIFGALSFHFGKSVGKDFEILSILSKHNLLLTDLQVLEVTNNDELIDALETNIDNVNQRIGTIAFLHSGVYITESK